MAAAPLKTPSCIPASTNTVPVTPRPRWLARNTAVSATSAGSVAAVGAHAAEQHTEDGGKILHGSRRRRLDRPGRDGVHANLPSAHLPDSARYFGDVGHAHHVVPGITRVGPGTSGCSTNRPRSSRRHGARAPPANTRSRLGQRNPAGWSEGTAASGPRDWQSQAVHHRMRPVERAGVGGASSSSSW